MVACPVARRSQAQSRTRGHARSHTAFELLAGAGIRRLAAVTVADDEPGYMNASTITACSNATVTDDSTTTEAEYTQIFSSSCCSGGDGVCGAFSYEYGSSSYSYSYSFSGECYYGCATCDGPDAASCLWNSSSSIFSTDASSVRMNSIAERRLTKQ